MNFTEILICAITLFAGCGCMWCMRRDSKQRSKLLLDIDKLEDEYNNASSIDDLYNLHNKILSDSRF